MKALRVATVLASQSPTTRAILRCLVGCAATAAFSDRTAPSLPTTPSPSGCS